MTRFSNWLDGMAMGTSAACLVHCLALPLAAALLPVLSLGAGSHAGFHLAVLLLAAPAAAVALGLGFRLHRSMPVLALGAAGVAMLILGEALHDRRAAELGVTVAGSLLLAAAHLRNWRLRRIGGTCPA